VADLVAHAQLVGAVVDEEDGEDAVVDDGADEFGGAGEQGLQVERGVEGVSQLDEEVELGGLHARECGRGFGGVVGRGVPGRGWGFGGHGYRIGMITEKTVVSDQ